MIITYHNVLPFQGLLLQLKVRTYHLLVASEYVSAKNGFLVETLCTHNCNNRNGIDYIERVMHRIDINARMFTQTTKLSTLKDRVCVCARERDIHKGGAMGYGALCHHVTTQSIHGVSF